MITASRPLGAAERVIDYWTRRHPLHFSLVAEVAVDVGTLTAGLRALQARHPMLAVEVDRSGADPVFRSCSEPIPLRCNPAATPWTEVVAQEQTPFAPAPGPSVRAVLVPGSTLVLTFAHQVADGVGGLQALQDLLALCAGEALDRSAVLPGAQEDLIPTPAAIPDVPAGTGPSATTVPDGLVPTVQTQGLDAATTTLLRERCRTEGTTVHAVLCVAAADVLHAHGLRHVDVLTPIDLRRALGLPAEVVVRFTSGRTTHPADEDGDLWARARRVHADLQAQRDPEALRAMSALVTSAAPGTPEAAEAVMTAGVTPVQVTNLGAVPGDAALWGPVIDNRFAGQRVVGALTSGGVLRLVEVTHDPIPDFLADLVRQVRDGLSK